MFWIVIGVQAVVFVLWAYTAFGILFHLAGRARAKTGQLFSGPFTFLGVIGDWLADPERRAQRWRLLILTLVMFALIALNAMVLPAVR